MIFGYFVWGFLFSLGYVWYKHRRSSPRLSYLLMRECCRGVLPRGAADACPWKDVPKTA